MKSIKNLRTDYLKSELNVEDLAEEPVTLFKKWLSQAISYSNDANAFVLSTVNSYGLPSSRVLLLRDVTEKGFSFFTNYSSRKSQEIEVNPNVCMNFFWPEMERQVRINGSINRLSEKESDDYFNSRPYESKIGAWSSPQSQLIKSREVLEKKIKEIKKKYPNEVPRPENWGGYFIIPNEIEFWQGRASRLHDRFLYKKEGKSWMINRLAP
ncbi:MAG: pyridoxamine 5'-phosphate oxidase [Flavobacteriales bacterium]|nr:pyridoxamine 5'-phosphate oxidase [Flavobacteriales bacterium]|tara:strand:+ start:686 stop:1318 length:633 start_codon:yes stop_codon:yes gene_type:complete